MHAEQTEKRKVEKAAAEKTAAKKIVVTGIGKTGFQVSQRMYGWQPDTAEFIGVDGEGPYLYVFDAALQGARMMIIVIELTGRNTDRAIQLGNMAKERGIFTVAVAAESIRLEDGICSGEDPCVAATEEDIRRMKKNIDSITIIPRDKILEPEDGENAVWNPFIKMDNMICRMVQSLISILSGPPVISIDVEDLRHVMGGGMSYIGVGEGKGADKATEAARKALENLCRKDLLHNAARMLVYLEGNVKLSETSDVCHYIEKKSKEEIDMMFGCSARDSDDCTVTVIVAENNLWRETLACLKDNGKTEKDVLWVGRGFGKIPFLKQYQTTWEDFKSKAVEYRFGMSVIPEDLVIVGENFWLERNHSGKSDKWGRWDFKTMPMEPMRARELKLEDDDWLYETRMEQIKYYLGHADLKSSEAVQATLDWHR